MPMTMPAASALSEATFSPSDLPAAANPGRKAQRGEEAEHHRRNTGEDFKDRLGESAEARRRISRPCVNGGEQADRPGDQHGDGQ